MSPALNRNGFIIADNCTVAFPVLKNFPVKTRSSKLSRRSHRCNGVRSVSQKFGSVRIRNMNRILLAAHDIFRNDDNRRIISHSLIYGFRSCLYIRRLSVLISDIPAGEKIPDFNRILREINGLSDLISSVRKNLLISITEYNIRSVFLICIRIERINLCIGYHIERKIFLRRQYIPIRVSPIREFLGIINKGQINSLPCDTFLGCHSALNRTVIYLITGAVNLKLECSFIVCLV